MASRLPGRRRGAHSCLSISPSGELWIGGSYEEGLRLGEVALPALEGAPFVAKLGPAGAHLASRAFIAATDGVFRPAAAVLGIVATDSGAYATGYFTQTLALGLEEREGLRRRQRLRRRARLQRDRAVESAGSPRPAGDGARARAGRERGPGAARQRGGRARPRRRRAAHQRRPGGALRGPLPGGKRRAVWGEVLSNGQYLYARTLQTQPSGAIVIAGMGNGELPLSGGKALQLGNQDVFLLELAP